MNLKEEKAERVKAAGKRVLDEFTDSSLTASIRDVLNKKSFEIAKIVFKRDYQYTRGLNYMIWNLGEWYKQTPKHNRKDEEEKCKEITDTKDREKCLKIAKQPADLHNKLFPAFVKACGDTIPTWEQVESYLRDAWKSNYKVGTEEERAEKAEEEEMAISMTGTDGAGAFGYDHEEEGWLSHGWDKEVTVWDKKAKENYIRRFSVDPPVLHLKTVDKAGVLTPQPKRLVIPLPKEIGTIPQTTGEHKGYDIMGIWVWCWQGACGEGDLWQVISESTSKVECEEMLSWWAFEKVKKRSKRQDVWKKVNKWLFSLTEDEAKVKVEKEGKPKLFSMFTYITEEEFNAKDAFLRKHLPIWQHGYICGVRLKKDGTPYKTTRGRKRTKEEDLTRDKLRKRAKKGKKAGVGDACGSGLLMCKTMEEEITK